MLFSRSQSQDPPAPPQTCPWCEAKGQTVTLRTYAINLHETIRLCPSPMCIFPLVSRPLDVVLASLSSSSSPTTLPAQPLSDHHTPPSPECPDVLTPPAKRPRTQEACALNLNGSDVDTRTADASLDTCSAGKNGSTAKENTRRQNGFGEGETHIVHDGEDDSMMIEAGPSPRKHDDDDDDGGDDYRRGDGFIEMEMETSGAGSTSSAEGGGGRRREGSHTLATCASSSGPELLCSDIRTPVKPAQQEASGVTATTETAVECPVARGGSSLKGVSDHLESSSLSSSSSSSGPYATVTGAAVAMEEECPGSRRRAAKNTDELQPSNAATTTMTVVAAAAAAAADECSSSNAPGHPQPSEALSSTSAIPGMKTVARAECHSATDNSLLKSTADSQSSLVGEVATEKLTADGIKVHLKSSDPSAVVVGLSGKLQTDGINSDLQSADPSSVVGALAGKLQADGMKFGLQSSEPLSAAKVQPSLSSSSLSSSSSSSNADQKLSPTGDASWLDAMLVALCQCRALAGPRDIKRRRGRKRKGAECTEPHVMELCSRYRSASAALQPDRETEADLLRDVEMKLSELRSSALQLLQKPLQLRLELTRRTEASPALSLPVLLDQDEQAKDVFQHSVSWESQCYACGCSSDSRCSNTVTVHAYLLSGFHPLSAPVQITCSRCQTNLQKKILKESLPVVFAVHFDDGLAEDVVTACSFGPSDGPYVATVVIEHRRPENIFVSWSRQQDGSWRAYRDFTDVRGTPHPKLDIRAKDIHLVFWEVEPKDPPKPAARKSAKAPVTARRRRDQKVSSSLDSQTEEEPPSSVLLSKPQRATPSSLSSQAGVKPASLLSRHTVEDGTTSDAGLTVKEASLLACHETEDEDDHTPLSLVQEALSLSRRTSEEAADLPVEEDFNVPLSSDSPMEDEVISLCDSQTLKKAPLLPAGHEQELNPLSSACHSVETASSSVNTENKSSLLQNRDTQNKVPASQDQPTKDLSLLSLHGTVEERMGETLPSDDFTLSYPHEDTLAEALRPGDPNASAMDTSIGSTTLLETFEGLSHNDIVSLTTETPSGKARGGAWTALQNSAAVARGVSKGDDTRQPRGGSEEGHVVAPSSPHLVRRSRRLEVKREQEEEEEKKHEQDKKDGEQGGVELGQETAQCSTRKVTPHKQAPVVCLRPLSLSPQTLSSHSNTMLIPADHTHTTADAGVGSGQSPNLEQNMPLPSGPVISPVVVKPATGRTLNRQNSTGTLQQQPPPQHSSQQTTDAGLKTPNRQASKCVVMLSPLQQNKILLQMLAKDRDVHNPPTTITEVSLTSLQKQKVALLSPTTPKPKSPIVIPTSTPTASKVTIHNPRAPKSTKVSPPNAPSLSATAPGSKPLPQTPPVKQGPVQKKPPAKQGKVCDTTHSIHLSLVEPTTQSPAKQGPLLIKLTPESLGMHKPEMKTAPSVHNETAKPTAVQNPAVTMDSRSLPDTQIQTPTETQPSQVMHTPEKTGTVNVKPPMPSLQPRQSPQTTILPVQNSVQQPEQTQLVDNSHQQNLPLKLLHTPSAQNDIHNPLLQSVSTISTVQNQYDQTTMDTLPLDTIITLNLDIEMAPSTDAEPERPPELATTVVQNQNVMASQNPTPPIASLTALPPCLSTVSKDPKNILQSLEYPTFSENLMPLPLLTEASAVETPGLQTPHSQPTKSVPPITTRDSLQSPAQATPTDSWSAEDTEIPLNLDTEMDFAEQNETEDEADESDLILPSIVKSHSQITVPKSATVDTSTLQPPISPAPTPSPTSSLSSVSHKSKPSPLPNQPSTKQQQKLQPSVTVSKEKEESSKAPTLPKVTLQPTSSRPHMFSGFKFQQPSVPGDELPLSGATVASSSAATGPTALLNGFVSRQPVSRTSVPMPHPSLPSHAPAPKPNASLSKMAAKSSSSSSPPLTGLAALVGGKKPGSLPTGARLMGEKTSPPGGQEDSKSAAMRLKLLKKLKAKKKQLAKLDRMMQQRGGGASQCHSAPPSVMGNSSIDTSPTGSTHLLSPPAASTTTPSPASSDGTEILEMLAGGGGGGLDALMGVPERLHNVARGPHMAATGAPAGGGGGSSDFTNIDDFLDGVIFDTSVGAEKEVENTDFDSLDMFF